MMMKCPERNITLPKPSTHPKNTGCIFGYPWVQHSPVQVHPRFLKSHGVSCVNVEAHDATARIEHKDSRPK